jgi:hypothetical protein
VAGRNAGGRRGKAAAADEINHQEQPSKLRGTFSQFLINSYFLFLHQPKYYVFLLDLF